jgi:hypothetical protein
VLSVLASILFIAFLAFIAIAPQEAIQIFLMLSWSGMLITALYQARNALLS